MRHVTGVVFKVNSTVPRTGDEVGNWCCIQSEQYRAHQRVMRQVTGVVYKMNGTRPITGP